MISMYKKNMDTKNEQTGSTLDPVAQKLCGYRFSLSWSTTLDRFTSCDLSCLNG